MNNKNSSKNKTVHGLISFIPLGMCLLFVLAILVIYDNNLTGSVVKEIKVDNQEPQIKIELVNDIKILNHLNEGWYQVKNGYVFYLESFDSPVLLYIKVKNPEQQNGFFVVDKFGNIKFDKTSEGLFEKEIENK